MRHTTPNYLVSSAEIMEMGAGINQEGQRVEYQIIKVVLKEGAING